MYVLTNYKVIIIVINNYNIFELLYVYILYINIIYYILL